MVGTDPAALERFVQAQANVYEQALDELRDGHKRSHWMWFVFPQLAGLGRSEMAARYAIRDLVEARAYLQHPLLGPRLRECTEAVDIPGLGSVADIFGAPDDRKFHSSMTLFDCASARPTPFSRALQRYFDGAADRATLRLLGGSPVPPEATAPRG